MIRGRHTAWTASRSTSSWRPPTGAPARYDAISFNFGLHDLGNRPSDISTYAAQLAAIADRLVKTKAKLLYLMTTPMMPECCAGAALLPSGEGAPVPKCSAGAQCEANGCHCARNCKAGKYAAAFGCTVCKEGQYQDMPGQPNCTFCAVGKYLGDDAQVDGAKHDSADDCLDCPLLQTTHGESGSA